MSTVVAYCHPLDSIAVVDTVVAVGNLSVVAVGNLSVVAGNLFVVVGGS